MLRAGNPHLQLARKAHNGVGSKKSGLENGRGRSQFWPLTQLPWQAVQGKDHTTGCVPVMGGHSLGPAVHLPIREHHPSVPQAWHHYTKNTT